jgi:hypothetical protein
MNSRPVLLNSCARATTAREAAFRIDYPLAPARATRVVALDGAALAVVRRAASQSWHRCRFFGAEAATPMQLRSVQGEVASLSAELADADTVVMLASSDEAADAASAIGAACTDRGIMTAGLVLADAGAMTAALRALRPHARMLLVPADGDDLIELLRAVRA